MRSLGVSRSLAWLFPAFVGLAVGCRTPAEPVLPDGSASPGVASASEPCGDGPSCGIYDTCVEHFPIADAPGPAAQVCVQTCSYAGDDCPEGQFCAMESAGTGFLCRAFEPLKLPADIERVVQLAEIWSLVRFGHPWLAYRDLDWGAALREAIPAARAAESDEAMREVVGQMLATLGDPATHVLPKPTVYPKATEPTRQQDGALVVSFTAVSPYDRTMTAKIAEQIAEADRVVFDLRGWPAAYMGVLDVAFAVWGPQLADGPVPLPSVRERVFHGYPSEAGMTSGGYYEAFESPVVGSIEGERKGSPPRVAFVIGESQALPGIALPLWESGRGVLVADRILDARAMVPTTLHPVAGGYLQVRAGEVTYRGGQPRVVADVVAGKRDDPIALAIARLARPGKPRRRTYPTDPLPPVDRTAPVPEPPEAVPDLAHRMHAAIDLWSTIDVFHAYPALRPRWDGALGRALARMDEADTWDAYIRVMLTLNASTDDGHSSLSGPRVTDVLGPKAPPISVAVVEGCLVVTAVHDLKLAGELAVGDVIMEIDGVPFSQRYAQRAPLVAASTPGAHRRRVGRGVLRGAKEEMWLAVDRDGERRNVSVQRVEGFRPPPSDAPVYRYERSVGVVDLSRLQRADVPAMFEQMAGTDGIIFDLRGYPRGTAWTIAPYLDRHAGPTPAARFLQPLLAPGELDRARGDYGRMFVQTLPEGDVERYEGRTVMLVDDRTISQAEHTGLFFEAANGTMFMGTPSAGANGDITARVLPDGATAWFTGQAVSAVSGRPLQRVGLPLEMRVEPTLAGIRAGRDEVLEAAVDWLDPPRLIEEANERPR